MHYPVDELGDGLVEHGSLLLGRKCLHVESRPAPHRQAAIVDRLRSLRSLRDKYAALASLACGHVLHPPMLPVRIIFVATMASLALAQESADKQLSNIQQLTSGGQNAEAYWSPDGARLIFQSTRGALQCDQIFIMNADGSGQHTVSTGKGRTTCGYFLPDGKHIVYASTHLAGDACPPAADRSKGYVWAVYPSYDIFEANDDGSALKRLTDAPGYDAEATVNWKKKKIVYTSLSSGDLDLWTMNFDGSHKEQLTDRFGYDGGPVFSRDGAKLVWRANHPETPEARK